MWTRLGECGCSVCVHGGEREREGRGGKEGEIKRGTFCIHISSFSLSLSLSLHLSLSVSLSLSLSLFMCNY